MTTCFDCKRPIAGIAWRYRDVNEGEELFHRHCLARRVLSIMIEKVEA